jgi:hypothetical protein
MWSSTSFTAPPGQILRRGANGPTGLQSFEGYQETFEGFGCRRAISRVSPSRRDLKVAFRQPSFSESVGVFWVSAYISGNFASYPVCGNFQSFHPCCLRPEKAAAAFEKCKFSHSRNLMNLRIPDRSTLDNPEPYGHRNVAHGDGKSPRGTQWHRKFGPMSRFIKSG